MEEKRPLIVLTGPTAVGKTALSIKLAKKIGGEIISADSMQVYKYMDIGSAKITVEQMQGVPHHLIDVLNPEDEFNVYTFQTMAKESLKGIYERGHIPIVAGGTGFYIQALLYDINFEPEEENTEIRKKLEKLQKEKGSHYLYELLKEKDPDSALEIHENNGKRIIRALEFYELNGIPISLHNKEQRKKETAYRSCYFVLNDDRQKLYERIDKRVDEMLESGLLQEVCKLKDMGYHRNMVSMQGLGYKEMLSYLEGELPFEDAVYLIKRDSRHFAKRQLTWFRREKDVIWIDKQAFSYDDEKILEFIIATMKQKGIV
ncbi:MAG: tRNA (adenosine(37)-N6)-dimethylallyltransferase MiaA [Lachnospiraceae bacterium]|nr:tRNA (adenosine(37)-N6)-dimethylallyltransferase MiaA [Lachnospiraceae bacterium]